MLRTDSGPAYSFVAVVADSASLPFVAVVADNASLTFGSTFPSVLGTVHIGAEIGAKPQMAEIPVSKTSPGIYRRCRFRDMV